MAKKDYPGLVLVPPSDRTILKRRLLRWTLFISALIWCASILPVWPPSSDDTTNCQSGAEQKHSNGSTEPCDQLPFVAEPVPHQSEFSLTPISQAEGLRESQSLQSSLIPDPPQFIPQNSLSSGTEPKPSDPIDSPIDYLPVPSDDKPSTSNPPPAQSSQNSDTDIRLAEQGDAFAQYRLGRYHARHDGKQAPESVRWYKKSSVGLRRLAEAGNGEAMYVLGVMYAYGRGVTRNTEEARHWLTQAVRQNVTAAQPVLANLPAPLRPLPPSQLHSAEQTKTRKQQN